MEGWKILNIKLSGAPSVKRPIELVKYRCLYKFGWSCREFTNFIQIYGPNSLRISLFKKGQSNLHINITGIKALDGLKHLKRKISNLLLCQPNQLRFQIDNITLWIKTCDHKLNLTHLHLSALALRLESTLNFERLSGVCVTFYLRTARIVVIFYSSGTAIAFGLKSSEQCQTLVQRALDLVRYAMNATNCAKEPTFQHSTLAL